MEIELIWQRDCPNVPAARSNLMRAFSSAGVPARWREWDVEDDGCPAHARAFGSPTILVNGQDVAGVAAGDGQSCRVYRDGEALVGVPPVQLIADALAGARREQGPEGEASAPSADAGEAPQGKEGAGGFSWSRAAALAPSVGVALLPKIACPACWPAYAGVLSSFGVTFLIDSRYLFALTAVFLAIALFFLGFRASRRRGYGPLAIGALASTFLLVGKFYFENDTAMFTGVGMLMGASFWNSWPRKLAASPSCSGCEPSAEVRSSETASTPAACCVPPQGETS